MNTHSNAQSDCKMWRTKDGGWGITLLVRLQLPADAGLELEGLGLVVEFHSCCIDYPTRLRDRHRLVGLDLILLWQDVKVLASHDNGALVAFSRDRFADALDLAGEVRVLLVAGNHAAIGGDANPRLAGFAEGDQRPLAFGGVAVRGMARNPGRNRLPDVALRVEAYGLEILDVQIGIVAAGAIECRAAGLHLSVQPIGQCRESAEEKHGRPCNQPVQPSAAAGHDSNCAMRCMRSPRAPRMSSQTSRTAPAPPSARVM